ncbi:serine/threonine protein phosphatase [Sphingobacterium psychroaquaticum]|uniref:metallophosphoesterase n=1 Tax=Sphingobacterium psychroaquaticum TaxID=561061 RepID=UPI00106CA602|nr:metallophosphoesterase [Sphingobacterium psychroaquaticum]QBQ41691.1 serine/threonine protein phosphatase [Sphingobacterium psychroaquaticum]
MKTKSKLNVLLLSFLTSILTVNAQNKPTFQSPALSHPESWTMVLLPDIQNYVKFQRNQPILDVMMNWIVENEDKLRIKLVLCTGDLVEHDDIVNPDFRKMDQTGKQQWEAAAKAFTKLDGKLPYITATGNHDYNIFSYTHKPKTTHFPTYFYADKNRENQKILREVAPNVYGNPSLENAAYQWVSPHGKPFLFLSLEFAPRDTILTWAKQLIHEPKYQDHQVVLLTHAYLNYQNEHIKTAKYDLQDANYGTAVFEKLVQPSKNIEMVFSGHIGAPDDPRKHVGFRIDKNSAGKDVSQMTFNAQALGGGTYGSGGDGWIRILEFLPDGKTVRVKTFSPLFALSSSTQDKAWRTADYDEFTINLN